MIRSRRDRPHGPSAERLGVTGLAVLALWFFAVLVNVFVALNAVVGMGYFERTSNEWEELLAARPWAWGSMIGFLVLAALGWWMGSRWWPALLVASTGVAGIVQLLLDDDQAPLLVVPFLLATIVGAIATIVIARPFPRPIGSTPGV